MGGFNNNFFHAASMEFCVINFKSEMRYFSLFQLLARMVRARKIKKIKIMQKNYFLPLACFAGRETCFFCFRF
jgi:hypothetical protein